MNLTTVLESASPDTPIVLDGGLATELQRRGHHVTDPWWTNEPLLSEHGLEQLQAVHADYAGAGARVITANTFRTNRRTLARNGLDEYESARLCALAVEQARKAADGASGIPLVAGSVAPVEDCYRPDLVPDDDELVAEHDWLAQRLAESGVDFVLVETMNTIREARVAVGSARRAGVSAAASFVCADGRLLSGEPLTDAVRSVEDFGAECILINCTAPEETEHALEVLHECSRVPIGAYPNLEDRSGIDDWTPVDRYVPNALSAEELTATTERWMRTYGAVLLGACCGSQPEHIEALSCGLAKTTFGGPVL